MSVSAYDIIESITVAVQYYLTKNLPSNEKNIIKTI